MESVASELKSQREKQNISLAQIAKDTRISLRYLESLEAGRYSDLPGGIYNRAFLRAFCERLNIDQKAIIKRYEEEISPRVEKSPKSKVQSSSHRHHAVLIWSAILLIVALVLFLNRNWLADVFSQAFHSQPGTRPEPSKQPATPSPSSSVQPGSMSADQSFPSISGEAPKTSAQSLSVPSEHPAQTDAVPSVGGTSDAATSAVAPPYRLEIVGKEECWVKVESDGIPALIKLIEPGEVRSFSATEKFFITIGNAGGIQLKINGKLLKSIGQSGDVRRLLIDEETLPDLLDPNAG
jgi:cytoskeleton protein RodZ